MKINWFCFFILTSLPDRCFSNLLFHSDVLKLAHNGYKNKKGKEVYYIKGAMLRLSKLIKAMLFITSENNFFL